MFGYILPDKPELKIKEFAAYRAVYCSLCGALRDFGFGAKALLNYDFVFAAMLMMAVRQEDAPKPCEGRCNTNPLEKINLIPQNAQLRSCAAALLISARYKFMDNARDEGLFKRIAARFLLFALRPAFRRAACELPQFDRTVKEQMDAQSDFEKSGLDSIDRACDATATGLASFFSSMSVQEKLSCALQRLGYLIGRYVYLADAGDDLAEDLKKGRYNPLILRFGLSSGCSQQKIEQAKDELKAQLYATIAQIETCYQSIPLTCYREILDNIIYLGLYKTAQEIGTKKKGKSRP